MISILSPSSEAFLANMARVQRTIDEASRQTSSGKRVNVASDAPGELDTILQLHTDETRNTQIQENLAVAKADADDADGALTSATQLMDRARVLAAQGATFTVDAAGRQSIAGEVQSLLEQTPRHHQRPIGVCHQRRTRQPANWSCAAPAGDHRVAGSQNVNLIGQRHQVDWRPLPSTDLAGVSAPNRRV